MQSPPPVPPLPSPGVGSIPSRRRGRGCLWAGVALAVVAGLGIVAVVVLGVVGQAFAQAVGGAASSGPRVHREHLQGKQSFGTAPYLASVQVEGAIMDSENTLAVLKAAQEDANCRGVLLEVNSPGGGVTASDEIWNGVKRLQAAGKPVVVYMGALAASGGYYIAAPADWIVASPTTLTGSIGVIIQAPAYGDALGRIGVTMRTFTSGPNKAMLSPTEELTPEQSSLVQGLVDTSYDRFVQVVAEGRKMDPMALRQGVADGRVVDAQTALDQRLVDELGYREDALGKALELTGLPADTAVIRLSRSLGLGDLLGLPMGKVEVEVLPSLVPELQTGMPYYLSWQGVGPEGQR